MNQEQFKQLLKEKFGGKYQVATWETVPHDENGDYIINVGLAKADLTFAEACELPSEVDGVQMVYSYVGPMEILTTNYYDPLVGGVSIGAIDITAGTYGGVVYDKITGDPYLLTNEHVVSNTSNNDPNHPPMGWPIVQPGPLDGGRKPAVGFLSKVGGLKEKALKGESANIDAALVIGDRDTDTCNYLGIGYVEEYAHTDAEVGDEIIKSGRTTGVTTNSVAVLGISANIGGMSWGNPVVVEDVIQSKSSFVKGGDSGSRVWKKSTLEPIGIVFAGSWLVSLIIPAQTISDQLGVVFGYKEADKQNPPNIKESWLMRFFRKVWTWLKNLFGGSTND